MELTWDWIGGVISAGGNSGFPVASLDLPDDRPFKLVSVAVEAVAYAITGAANSACIQVNVHNPYIDNGIAATSGPVLVGITPRRIFVRDPAADFYMKKDVKSRNVATIEGIKQATDDPAKIRFVAKCTFLVGKEVFVGQKLNKLALPSTGPTPSVSPFHGFTEIESRPCSSGSNNDAAELEVSQFASAPVKRRQRRRH